MKFLAECLSSEMLPHKLGAHLGKCTWYQVRTTEEVRDYHELSAKKILSIFSLFLGAWERLISGEAALWVSVGNLYKSRWQISEATGHHVHSMTWWQWWQWQGALKPSATHWCTLEVESSHSLGTVCVLCLVLLESQSQGDIYMRYSVLNWTLTLVSSNSHCQNR